MPTPFTRRRKTMRIKAFLKSNLGFIIFLAVFGVIGGIFTGLWSLETISPEMLEESLAMVGSEGVLIFIGVVQVMFYSVFLGIVGKAIAERIGLWREWSFDKKGALVTGIVILVGGAMLILPDVFIFSHFSEAVADSYLEKPTLNYIITALTYGGVVEEVMMRLFLMSLVALVISRFRADKDATSGVVLASNIIVALVFAAGHLPATAMTTGITVPILIRCFLLNGGFGFVFGYLYQKYGIYYAMAAHAGVHLVSKLIWIIFI